MNTDIHTLAGAYALDAVSDIERAEFARHLAACDSCGQEIAELRETVSRLTDASATPPPARMKSAVLEAASRTRQLPPGRIIDQDAARRSRSRGWRGYVAAAAAAVVIAAGAGTLGYTISNQRVRTEQQQAAAAAALNARMTAVLTAPDANVHTQHLAGGGDVTVVLSASLDQGVAVLGDMPPLSGNDVYQLWLIHGAQPVSAGVMDPGVRSGTAFLTNLTGVTSFGVSSEHVGGATAPSSPLVTSFSV